MKLNLLVSIILLFSVQLSVAQLNASLDIANDSEKINDGRASVFIVSGTAPYTYKWSDQDTPLSSSRSNELSEGVSFTVEVFDATGESVTLIGEVPVESVEERINSIFMPVVGVMTNILFWDPFSAVGIYDPVVYADQYNLAAPGWADKSIVKIDLKEWYAEDAQKVEKGDSIALVLQDGKNTVTVFAGASGTLRQYYQPGETIYDGSNIVDVIQQGAQHLGTIEYGQPTPVTHPNGDPQEKAIPFIVIWLVLGAIFFTLRMGFVNFRGVGQALRLVSGKYSKKSDAGEVSHFQALTTALSATVGLGNIAGVAVAIVIGGPGATFWMIVAGLLGMASKFTECTLGVKYRKIDKNGVVSGGPMYYLTEGLAKRNMAGLGKVLAVLFALLCIGGSFGGGNMFQANQAFAQVASKIPFFEGNGVVFGIILAILVGLVILGGIKSIARVTDKIVPFMVGMYVIFSLIIIFMNFGNVQHALMAIFDGAFNSPAIKGGVIGVLIVGFQRAAFSNEAGVGSASIAHSASKTKYPVSEGLVSLLEPFIDTVVVCTMTALVLIFTGFAETPGDLEGSALTSAAFSSVFSWFDWVLLIAIVLFAFSTMISWSYYGLKAWNFVFGKSKRSSIIYKGIFLIFIVIGSSVGLGAVLDFSDLMILGMAFPNILGLLLLSGEVRQDLKTYFRKIKNGEIERFKK